MRPSRQLVHRLIIGLGAIMSDAFYTPANIIEGNNLIQFIIADPKTISLFPVDELG